MNNISHTKIVPYQKEWPEKFELEKQKLQPIFGDKALEIEHIGSTSIPGLSSKPIIDIAVLIEHIDDAESFINDLEKIGYSYDPNGIGTERHFLRKYGEDNFHLSIAYKNQGGFWPRQISFRDYLRNHPDLRDEYDKLKKDLLQQDPSGSDEYISGKTEFVYKVLKLAGWKEGQKYNDN